jgi:hypothetical protein
MKEPSTPFVCMEDEVLFNIIGDETRTSLYNRLESLYMTKSLMNKSFLCNDPFVMSMNSEVQ